MLLEETKYDTMWLIWLISITLYHINDDKWLIGYKIDMAWYDMIDMIYDWLVQYDWCDMLWCDWSDMIAWLMTDII